jgi:hypothetical protein
MSCRRAGHSASIIGALSIDIISAATTLAEMPSLAWRTEASRAQPTLRAGALASPKSRSPRACFIHSSRCCLAAARSGTNRSAGQQLGPAKPASRHRVRRDRTVQCCDSVLHLGELERLTGGAVRTGQRRPSAPATRRSPPARPAQQGWPPPTPRRPRSIQDIAFKWSVFPR